MVKFDISDKEYEFIGQYQGLLDEFRKFNPKSIFSTRKKFMKLEEKLNDLENKANNFYKRMAKIRIELEASACDEKPELPDKYWDSSRNIDFLVRFYNTEPYNFRDPSYQKARKKLLSMAKQRRVQLKNPLLQ